MEVGRQKKDQFFLTQNNVATVDLFNPVLPVIARQAAGAPSTDNLGTLTVKSAYLQDLATIAERWKVLAGVRFDEFRQQTRERRVGQTNLDRTNRAWSPRAGVVYQPTLDQAWYASVSKSFQPSGESFPLAANNAQIEPEETTSREAGAKIDFLDGQASATASVFRLERTNIKFTDPASNRLVPIGTQRTDGVEFTFTGHLPYGLQIWSGVAFLDARITSSPAIDSGQPVQGKRPTLTPNRSANLWLTKGLAGGFGAGAGVNHVGDRFANPGNTVTLPAYTTIDAMVYYRARTFDVQLNITNVSDRDYIVAGHGSNGNLNLPGAPRAAQVTVRYVF